MTIVLKPYSSESSSLDTLSLSSESSPVLTHWSTSPPHRQAGVQFQSTLCTLALPLCTFGGFTSTGGKLYNLLWCRFLSHQFWKQPVFCSNPSMSARGWNIRFCYQCRFPHDTLVIASFNMLSKAVSAWWQTLILLGMFAE